MPFDPSRPMSLQKYIDEEPKLNEEASRDEKIEKLLDISLKLGLKRHAIHAAGVVTSKDEILKDVHYTKILTRYLSYSVRHEMG